MNKKMLKGIIDLLIIAGIIACAASLSVFDELKEKVKNGANIEDVFSWGTSHCIVSLILTGIIFIHLWQHRIHIKAIITKKLYLKNKLTTLLGVLFILSVISIALYLSGFTRHTLHFHNIVVHIFLLFAIIHLIVNFKKLISLFK